MRKEMANICRKNKMVTVTEEVKQAKYAEVLRK